MSAIRIPSGPLQFQKLSQPAGSSASLYEPDDPAKEARQIFPEDPRSVPKASGEAESPYLDRVSKAERGQFAVAHVEPR